ncbi:MAG: ABC transporter permease [Thiohalomonadaceae bacterium]
MTGSIAFRTILIKEIRRFLRIWIQTILPPMITTALYFIIFGRLIGNQIGAIAGHSYMDYIVPGLILMAVITNSYANVVSSFYGAKFSHYVEELLIAPIPNSLILAGYVAGGLARGLTVGTVVALVAMFFTDLQVHNLAVVLSVVVLTAVLFSLGGFINAIYAKSFDDISIIPTFVLTPLTYLGGIFYSIDMLPPFWREVSLLNPILYMINAFRYGLLGVTDIPLGTAFGVTLLFILALAAYALFLLQRGVGLKN